MFEGITSTIEFQMSLLLFVSLAGYILASKINQSAIIGIILAGLIIGPSVLGLVTYTEFVHSIANLGAVILLFVVGLEFKLKEIFKIKFGIIALIGVIVPWIGGFLVAKFFGFGFASSVFVGTALTATSVAITANVLKEMNVLHTEVAKAIIGAAVIDDILGLLVLSTSEQIASNSVSIFPIAMIFLKALIFVVAGSFIGSTILTKMVRKVDSSKLAKKFPEIVFIFAMMVAFLYAMTAEYIGLSGIIGAFIAGVSLENITIRNGKNYKEGAEYLHIIFASIFFVSLGILADIHALTTSVIFFLIVLTLVAVITKVVGCFIPARLQGMNFQESVAVGFGMAPRGEVAMIVALIGLNSGLIKQDIYVSLVLMSLVTTIVAPLFLRNWSFNVRKEKEKQ